MKLRLVVFTIFALVALPAVSQAQTFTNGTPFYSPAPTDQPDNVFTLYPSEIGVAGMVGAITDVNVTLRGATANGIFVYGRFLLVSPDGTGLVVWSQAGQAANNATLIIDQQAASTLSFADPVGAAFATVRYKPSVVGASSATDFPAPANVPADITPDLNRLNGRSANGVWKLYANHDESFSGSNTISINAGWSLDVETTGDITAPTLSRPAVSGRTIGFDVSEASSIQFRVDRISKGVKVKQRCLAPKKGRKGKGCNRYTPLPGAIDTIATAGINSFAWNGRIGSKKLAPGKYRLIGIATDAAGNQSPPQKFTVTIKKPKKKKKS